MPKLLPHALPRCIPKRPGSHHRHAAPAGCSRLLRSPGDSGSTAICLGKDESRPMTLSKGWDLGLLIPGLHSNRGPTRPQL